jgi:hypothetical protein
MYAVKRQFRIWGHEIALAWGKVGFFGRVFIGAGVSLGMAYGTVRYVIKPLNMDIAELSKGLVVPSNLDPERDEQIMMHGDRTKNLQSSIADWRRRVDTYRKQAEHLDPGAHLTVVASVKSIMERCGMTLISETLHLPPASARGRARSGSAPPAALADTGPMARFTHHYETQGSFRQIQAFLLLVEKLPWRAQLRDLSVREAAGSAERLSFKFTLDIFYLKERK